MRKLFNNCSIIVLLFINIHSVYCQTTLEYAGNKLLDFETNESFDIIIKQNLINLEMQVFANNDGIRDSIKIINEVTNIDSVLIVDRKFLIIHYSIRGGSGVHFRYLRIITIKNRHLYDSFALLDNYWANNKGKKIEEYNVNYNIKKDSGDYHINLSVIEKESDGKEKYCHQSLLFNYDYMIFSNIQDNMSQICIEDELGEKDIIISNDANLYSFNLDDLVYVFYKNHWYRKFKSSKCFNMI